MVRADDRSTRTRWIANGLVVGIPSLALTWLMILFAEAVARDGKNPPFVDWIVHGSAVGRVFAGQALFEARQLSGTYFLPDTVPAGYAYPPASVLPLIPFSGTLLGLVAWLALNIGVFLSGLWAALRRDLGDRTVVPFAFVLLGLMFFLPFASGVISANANLANAGIYAWCWAIGRTEGRIGLVAGLAAVVKVFPGALVLWPTGRARRESLVLAIGVAVGLTVVSLPLVGLQSWMDFPVAISNALLSCGEGRYSVPCALQPLLGTGVAKLAAIALGGLVLIAALRTRNDRLAFVLFGVAMLVPVPDMHPHYWLIAYVAAVVLIGGLLASRRRPDVQANQTSVH